MTKWILLACVLGLCCCGCAHKGYWGDRARDLDDVFSGAVGKGVGVKLQVLPFYASAFRGRGRLFTSGDFGLRVFSPIIADFYYYSVRVLSVKKTAWLTGLGTDESISRNDVRRMGQVSIAVGLGVAVAFGVNVVEAADLVLGLARVDFLHDDNRDHIDMSLPDHTVNPVVSLKPAVAIPKGLIEQMRNIVQ